MGLCWKGRLIESKSIRDRAKLLIYIGFILSRRFMEGGEGF